MVTGFFLKRFYIFIYDYQNQFTRENYMLNIVEFVLDIKSNAAITSLFDVLDVCIVYCSFFAFLKLIAS